MPAWIYALAVVAVLWAVFVAVFHPFKRGQHAAPRALPVRVDAGSMVLAEEQTAWLSAPPWEPPEDYSEDYEDDELAPDPFVDAWKDRQEEERQRMADTIVWPAQTAPLVPLGGQLGPRARAVLAAYDARCVERWGHAIAG